MTFAIKCAFKRFKLRSNRCCPCFRNFNVAAQPDRFPRKVCSPIDQLCQVGQLSCGGKDKLIHVWIVPLYALEFLCTGIVNGRDFICTQNKWFITDFCPVSIFAHTVVNILAGQYNGCIVCYHCALCAFIDLHDSCCIDKQRLQYHQFLTFLQKLRVLLAGLPHIGASSIHLQDRLKAVEVFYIVAFSHILRHVLIAVCSGTTARAQRRGTLYIRTEIPALSSFTYYTSIVFGAVLRGF